MRFYTIDDDNDIVVHANRQDALAHETANPGRGVMLFENMETLADWDFTNERLVEIWNSMVGVTPVKKFTDRKTAAKRIWNAIQTLRLPEETQLAQPTNPATTVGTEKETTMATAKKATKEKAPKTAKEPKVPKDKKERKPKAAKTPKPKREAGVPREGSKTEAVLALIRRAKGATIDELIEVTGWKANSVFGFISGKIQKKLGHKVLSTKGEDKIRRYQIAA